MAKAPADIRSLARAQTELAIRTLTGVCGSKAAPAAARVSAAQALLDRGWGKAQQDGNVQGEVRVVLRKMLDDDEDRCRSAVQQLAMFNGWLSRDAAAAS